MNSAGDLVARLMREYAAASAYCGAACLQLITINYIVRCAVYSPANCLKYLKSFFNTELFKHSS